jgi:hypothetical protein
MGAKPPAAPARPLRNLLALARLRARRAAGRPPAGEKQGGPVSVSERWPGR